MDDSCGITFIIMRTHQSFNWPSWVCPKRYPESAHLYEVLMPLRRFWNARRGWAHSSYGRSCPRWAVLLNNVFHHFVLFNISLVWCSIPAAGPVPGAGARLGVSFGEEICCCQSCETPWIQCIQCIMPHDGRLTHMLDMVRGPCLDVCACA